MAREPSLAALSHNDVADVEALRAMNNDTLGFMPMKVIEDYLRMGGGVGIRGETAFVAMPFTPFSDIMFGLSISA